MKMMGRSNGNFRVDLGELQDPTEPSTYGVRALFDHLVIFIWAPQVKRHDSLFKMVQYQFVGLVLLDQC